MVFLPSIKGSFALILLKLVIVFVILSSIYCVIGLTGFNLPSDFPYFLNRLNINFYDAFSGDSYSLVTWLIYELFWRLSPLLYTWLKLVDVVLLPAVFFLVERDIWVDLIRGLSSFLFTINCFKTGVSTPPIIYLIWFWESGGGVLLLSKVKLLLFEISLLLEFLPRPAFPCSTLKVILFWYTLLFIWAFETLGIILVCGNRSGNCYLSVYGYWSRVFMVF